MDFLFLAFGFQFSPKILMGFQIWYVMWFPVFLFGFRFLFDLSSLHRSRMVAKPLCAPLVTSDGTVRVLITEERFSVLILIFAVLWLWMNFSTVLRFPIDPMPPL